MLFAIGLLIAVALAAFVATPLLSAEGAGASTLPVDVTPLGDLKRRRLVVYENLKDLEFEHQAGKIAAEDYRSLRENYLGEAAALMVASQEAEQLSETDAVIEREIAARRAFRKIHPPQNYVCLHCGFENPVPVKFCGECGTKITDYPRNS
jgi:ribosomal protein L40E